MLAVAGSDGAVLVRAAAQIDVAKERLAVLHAAHHHLDPQRIEAAALLVQHARQPVVQRLRLHLDGVVVVVVVDHLLVNVLLDELEVGVVAAHADDGAVVDLEDAIDVAEARQRTVRDERVGGDDDAAVELEADDGATGRDGLAVFKGGVFF